MTKEILEKEYGSLDNKELLEIVDNKHAYTDLAVSIALTEIAKRNVSETEIQEYKNLQINEILAQFHQDSFESLTLLEKNLFYFFPLPFITFPFKLSYADEKFYMKLRQTSFFSWSGAVTLIIAIILYNIVDTSFISTIAVWVAGFIIAFWWDERIKTPAELKRFQILYPHAFLDLEEDKACQ